MERHSATRVLVLDADMVPSLTISRSLARRGCRVDVASHTPAPLSGYSRAVSSVYQCPDPLAAADDFVQWLSKHTATEHYDLVIPVTERTLVPLSRSREAFPDVKIAMSCASSLELVLDKSQTLALAERVGVPGPVGVLVQSIDELGPVQERLRYPVVLKPARSIGSGDGGASQLQVSYAFDAGELRAGCAHALRFGGVLLQEFFPGQGVGIELIAQQGKIVYAFQHRRVHEVPLTGGGSSLRKSEPINTQLLEASEKLIAALGWHGVAMVEFKQNPQTGDFCLMEINGRFWGSLPLADAAGADFPSMLLDLELDGQIKPCPPYRPGIYCRLLSRDMHWYEAVLRRDTQEGIARVPPAREVVGELGLLFSPRHRFDVQSFRDPLPGLVDIGRICSAYTRRVATLVREKRFVSRQKRAWRKGEVADAVAAAESLLFLCYGNINRSALADVMLRAYAEDSGIRVASAGFHRESNRPADSVMVDVAAQNGLNMDVIRSTVLTNELLNNSDVIFVMEKSHYDRLLEMNNSIASRVYLLGAHQGGAGWPAEIEDPFGRAREYYTACYERVAAAADSIKAMIAVSSGDRDGEY